MKKLGKGTPREKVPIDKIFALADVVFNEALKEPVDTAIAALEDIVEQLKQRSLPISDIVHGDIIDEFYQYVLSVARHALLDLNFSFDDRSEDPLQLSVWSDRSDITEYETLGTANLRDALEKLCDPCHGAVDPEKAIEIACVLQVYARRIKVTAKKVMEEADKLDEKEE